jgi:hypothetical protein
MIHLIALAIFVCAACTALAGGREFGHPLFRTFTARDYGEIGQILAVTEDAQGRMLFGCRNAVVAFDNNQWETIPVPGVGYIRSLRIDSRGMVWFRSNEQIGYLTRVGDQYRAVKAYSGSFGPNSRIAVAGDQVYFSTETGLVIWNNGHIYQQPWPANSFLPFSLALSHGKIRVGDRDGYIYEFEGNRFNRVAESAPTGGTDRRSGTVQANERVMAARLELARHRAHWIEMTWNTETYKTDFHKWLSDFLAVFLCDQLTGRVFRMLPCLKNEPAEALASAHSFSHS